MLMYHIREGEPTAKLNAGWIYNQYKEYCKDNDITLPASFDCLGKLVRRIYPNSNRDHTGHYTGVYFIPNSVVNSFGSVVFPDYCEHSLSKDGTSIHLKVPTLYVRDGETVSISVTFKGNSLSLSVLGKEVNLEEIGCSSQFVLNQSNLDGFLLGLQSLKLCQGSEWNEASDRKNVHEWRHGPSNSTTATRRRIHGKNCQVIMFFNANGDRCNRCRYYLKDLMSTINKENVKNVDGENACVGSSDSIELTQQSHEELSEILKRIMPNAPPDFQTLLESQVRNCAGDDKDPRHRRWDPKVISLCLSLWSRSPESYEELKRSQMLVLPSGRLLQYYKNTVRQKPGFCRDNLKWMAEEAKRVDIPSNGLRGGIAIDEMTIQEDLQILRKGDSWEIIGACDLGMLNGDIRILMKKKKECSMANEVLQIVFHGFTGFRWPVAYFPTSTANAYEIYNLFWDSVDILGEYGFVVDYCSVDGASTNRAFIRLHFDGDAKDAHFTARDIFDHTHKIVFLQDIKHTLKKVRNGIFSRKLELDGTSIEWEHWRSAFLYNKSLGIRIHKKLTADHIELTTTLKMRNHLALEVLDRDMLHLMQAYAKTLPTMSHLKSSITLLEKTSVLVDIFSDCNRPITSSSDPRMQQILDIACFFHAWETQVKEKDKLLTEQTREDISSSLLGFISLVTTMTTQHRISITPGFINSDIIENFFCQQRGICHGNATNPTVAQYGPAVNAIILGQGTVSKKGNAGQTKRGAKPANKLFPLNPKKKSIRV